MPSSSTRISRLPPYSTVTAMRVAPASMAFSTSSLTTEAGRSTTSPAAIWLARSSGSWRMRPTRYRPSRAAEPQEHGDRRAQHQRHHPPELRRFPAGKCGSGDVHAVEPGQHGERPEERRDHGEIFETQRQLVRDAGQVRVEDAGDPVLEHDRVVGQVHQLVVDVAEAVGHLLADHRRTRGGPAGRRRRAAACMTRRSDEMSRFTARISLVSASPAVSITWRSISSSQFLELVDLGPVVIDHRVDDAVHQARPGPRP